MRRRHDRELLDALEAFPAEAFHGSVWRVAAHGRDPLPGSIAGGRWSPPGEFEVLFTSLSRHGALAEVGYRLSLEPVWPSRARHDLHRISIQTRNSLRLANLAGLEPLGVDLKRYASFDYVATQAIASAACFLGYDGLIVPSARCVEFNLVLFLEQLNRVENRRADFSEPVDWDAWRADQERQPEPR